MNKEDVKATFFVDRTGVMCPSCGHGGASRYTCWCDKCHKNGEWVLMLPVINGTLSNWNELRKTNGIA